MITEDDYPRIGRDIQGWSELDAYLPKVDLEIELFRQNMSMASFVILSALIKQKKSRKWLLEILTSSYFDPQSLPRYLFEKIAAYLNNEKEVSVSMLEKWIPEYLVEIWGEYQPQERTIFGHQFNLRLILNFDPTEEQIIKAIELRKIKMEREGF